MFITVSITLLTIALVCWCLKKKYSYWKDQNIPQLRTWPLLGSYVPSNKPLQEIEQDCYRKYGRVYGRYDGSLAVLSVGEPEILRHVLVKDFHLFPKRRDVRFNDSVFDNTLFSLEGEDWKRVRNVVTPTFTSAKLKRMLPLMEDCCDLLIGNIVSLTQETNEVNLQSIFGAFTINTIARCSFGMTIDSLKSKDDPFVAKAKLLLHSKFNWRTFMTMVFPCLMKGFSISLLNPETTLFYRQTIEDMIERKKKTRGREDFLQLLLDAQTDVQDHNNNDIKSKCEDAFHGSSNQLISAENRSSKGLSRDELVAQCVTFFMAGYDATTSLLSHAMYHLATNEHYQQRVLEEIRSAMEKHNDVVNYDTLNELKFMDAVLNECMRLCPSMVRNERRVERDCTLPTTNIQLKRDMLVSIPLYAMHRDPEWFPDPDTFKPERFYEVDSNVVQFAHLPFGAGPRMCVGFRFVMVQVKLCLTRLLLRFHAKPSASTPAQLGFTEARNVLKVNDVEISISDRRATAHL